MRLSGLILLLCFLLTACAYGPRPKGASLYPSEKNEKGYSSVGRDNLFEDETIRVVIRHIKKGEAKSGPVIDGLLDKDYAVFSLAIENKSDARIMYNTTYTVLTSDALDYKKPLDFTDLYDITSETGKLAPLKGKFYDLNTTVAPGERTSRLLIFRPLSEEADDAEVIIKDLYIGTNTRDLSFPFKFKDESPE